METGKLGKCDPSRIRDFPIQAGFKNLNLKTTPSSGHNTSAYTISLQTLTLEIPGQSNTSIATAYISASLYDHGRNSVFWCSLLALACAGAYVIDKAKHHIVFQLLALDEGAKKDFSTSGAANNTIFGNSSTDGSYTLESWTCQIAPLLSSSADITTFTKTQEILMQSCRDAHSSRYLLLTMLPLTILMLLSIARPNWFTLTFGAEEKPAWTTVPLEENDKEIDSDDDDDDDADPMAAYGNNAREQWQLA
ncbi:unnamed protein product [Aureobasidium mustum]|uniref:Uncharacterized protein n=1 Tax=Aureobasidium mustum TaxID=2773714 RepID=A0A9N8PM36_9PEZI|nr:unnamed protein product [Aureobasidium mustum]